MSEKYKKTCKYLNYVEKLPILVSAMTGWVSISALASLVSSSAVGIKICAITAGFKKYKSVIDYKEKEEA